MKKLLVFGVVLVLLLSTSNIFFIKSISNSNEDNKLDINNERADYNDLLHEHLNKNPYRLGDKIIPFKSMIK